MKQKVKMKNIVDNAAGPSGLFGIWVGRLPQSPEELLIFLQTGLTIVCFILVGVQLIHWLWRFIKWLKK